MQRRDLNGLTRLLADVKKVLIHGYYRVMLAAVECGCGSSEQNLAWSRTSSSIWSGYAFHCGEDS